MGARTWVLDRNGRFSPDGAEAGKLYAWSPQRTKRFRLFGGEVIIQW